MPYKTVGILLEVFVNPLNMVHPRWAGVLLPLMVFLIGTASLRGDRWPAWIVFVVPILLAMIASSIQRYPFHGRLVLELVPAFYLLDRPGGISGCAIGSRGSAAWVRRCFWWLSWRYPCLDGCAPRRFQHCRATTTSMAICTKTYFFTTTIACRSNRTTIGGGIAEALSCCRAELALRRIQNTGMSTRFPPFIADSWAQRPTMVQLADVAASGRAGRSPASELKKAWTRCGCEPPWPPP